MNLTLKSGFTSRPSNESQIALSYPSMALHIERAQFPTDTAAIYSLFTSYAWSLGIDLTFQSFEDELNSLPGKYATSQGGALLIARVQKSDAGSQENTLGQESMAQSSEEPSTALREDSIVGCVGLRRNDEHWCEMKRLYVKPEIRGLRLGDRLVEAVLAEAKALGYRGIRLDTLPDMFAAQRLYRRHGFVEIKPYYDTPLKGTIFMGRELAR